VSDPAVAIVTGGTRGVGAAIVRALSENGHTVVPVGRSAAQYATDVSDPASVADLLAAVEAEVARPGILVNAAGMFGPVSMIADSNERDWIATVMVDLVGAYLTCRAFVPGMIEAGWGRVINVSSAASLHPPGILNSAYGTSKAGLNQFTRHLAAELEGTGVTANVIHPGDIKTEMWVDIRAQVERLGEIATDYAQWVDWVEETGGDPVEKAAELVLRIVDSDVNGRFLWIDDPLQPAIASWGESDQDLPWSRESE
jgi:NAD(P)-dependent dehydrogenase (short-subunit alcohol dehydrogenase family)